MTRIFPPAIVVFLSLTSCPVAHAGDAAAAGAVDLSGEWMSNVGPVTLRQQGQSITGTFSEGHDVDRNAYVRGKFVSPEKWKYLPGVITSGTFDPAAGVVTLLFHQDFTAGSATLKLSQDGKMLEGPFADSGQGGSFNGTWTLWRNNCGAAKYLEPC